MDFRGQESEAEQKVSRFFRNEQNLNVLRALLTALYVNVTSNLWTGLMAVQVKRLKYQVEFRSLCVLQRQHFTLCFSAKKMAVEGCSAVRLCESLTCLAKTKEEVQSLLEGAVPENTHKRTKI